MLIKEDITRHVCYTYVSIAVPSVFALILMPQIISNLGMERFGVFSFLLSITFYFNTFDLGVGSAVTRWTARFYGKRRGVEAIRRIVLVSLVFQLFLGASIGAIIYLIQLNIGFVPESKGNIEALETTNAIALLSLTVPLSLTSNVLRCSLEGMRLFKVSSTLKIFSTISFLGFPIITSFFTSNLTQIFLAILFSRILSLGFFVLQFSKSAFSINFQFFPVAKFWHFIAPLLSFGGWVMIGTVSGSMMSLGIIDRFFMSHFIKTSDLFYYAIPSDINNRLLLMPSAIASILLPIFSKGIIKKRFLERRLLSDSIKLIISHIGPVVAIFILNCDVVLGFLTGGKSDNLLRFIALSLSIGAYVHSIAHVPYCVLHAYGRPDLASIRHIIELPFYLLLSFSLFYTGHLELSGMLWAAWAIADYLLLEFCALKVGEQEGKDLYGLGSHRFSLLWLVVLIFCALISFYSSSNYIRVILTVFFITLFFRQMMRAKVEVITR